ncbi:MAG: hypothetical protein ACD_22C00283G0008 [uncultured bacterium]|nr:MAG: hypothetical protein ACD_22C00283G0008 [uncultured bacterium]
MKEEQSEYFGNMIFDIGRIAVPKIRFYEYKDFSIKDEVIRAIRVEKVKPLPINDIKLLKDFCSLVRKPINNINFWENPSTHFDKNIILNFCKQYTIPTTTFSNNTETINDKEEHVYMSLLSLVYFHSATIWLLTKLYKALLDRNEKNIQKFHGLLLFPYGVFSKRTWARKDNPLENILEYDSSNILYHINQAKSTLPEEFKINTIDINLYYSEIDFAEKFPFKAVTQMINFFINNYTFENTRNVLSLRYDEEKKEPYGEILLKTDSLIDICYYQFAVFTTKKNNNEREIRKPCSLCGEYAFFSTDKSKYCKDCKNTGKHQTYYKNNRKKILEKVKEKK